MDRQDIAIMFSGGTDSLALYALATTGRHPELPRPRKIHLLHMLNGFSRFHHFPQDRFELAQNILARQFPVFQKVLHDSDEGMPEAVLVEVDTGRLFQGLWLDRYEELMPKYGGKNLVCVACKLAMHAKAVMYCTENYVPVLATGYAKRQEYYPEQTPVFMEKISRFSRQFGITTKHPIYDEFDDQMTTRHVLEEFGLPSTGGGERKCLFCQTLTTATDKEIGHYLDDMVPRVIQFAEHQMAGRVRDAAACFPPGNIR